MGKIKTYRMSISKVFPKKHQKAGEETQFADKIYCAICEYKDVETKHPIEMCCKNCKKIECKGIKFHTCRINLKLWKKRIDEVNSGDAVLVLYEWTDKPYRSKTNELFRFDKDSGIGVQKLIFQQSSLDFPRVIRDNNAVVALNPTVLAKNDGISIQYFKDWFKGYDLSKPMAIIHFTKFRY